MAKKRDKFFYKWIEATLLNDEVSSDDEMLDYFMYEGKIGEREAKCYVSQRNSALARPFEFELQKCSAYVKGRGRVH